MEPLKVVLDFEPVDEILRCDYSNGTSTLCQCFQVVEFVFSRSCLMKYGNVEILSNFNLHHF